MLRYWPILAAIGFAGCLVSVWDEASVRAATPLGETPVIPQWGLGFWAAYLLATHILAPWHAVRMLGKRVKREVKAGQLVVYPWWTWLFLGPFFIGDPRAKAPVMLSGLLIWIACVLCAWMLLVLSAIAVGNIHGSLHKESNHAITLCSRTRSFLVLIGLRVLVKVDRFSSSRERL
jgi:hypothetical protein